MKLPRFFAIASLALLAGLKQADQARAANLAEEIVWYTNQVRASHGLPPLQVDPVLNRAALWHARTMASYGQMAHVLDGVGPGERLQQVGYPFSTYAENVAYNFGYGDPARAVMDSWIKSSGHFRNILNAQVNEIGVGFAVAPNGAIYYCQVFGAK